MSPDESARAAALDDCFRCESRLVVACNPTTAPRARLALIDPLSDIRQVEHFAAKLPVLAKRGHRSSDAELNLV
jgi:hypothetical protein